MVKISWFDFRHWISSGEQPRDYTFAAWLTRSLVGETAVPDELLQVDWTKSFSIPVVIVYDEHVTVEVLEMLHNYLRQQSADIENIVLVLTSALGVSDWWSRRNQLYHEKSFSIQEWLLVRSVTDELAGYLTVLNNGKKLDLQKIVKDQAIQYLFCHYGGANPTLDKQYLALKLRDLDGTGVVDMFSNFVSTRENLINHAYYLGYFKNRAEQKLIGDLYDQYVQGQSLLLDPVLQTIHTPKVRNEAMHLTGFQYELDCKCLAVVVGETDMRQPWTMITEKTIRVFFHHKILIHVHYKSISNLEKYGFWFPHDIIDYSYQNETDLLTRINSMIISIKTTHNHMQNRYQEYWLDNIDKFRHNVELLKHYYHTDCDP
jgi:hypothetical protein